MDSNAIYKVLIDQREELLSNESNGFVYRKELGRISLRLQSIETAGSEKTNIMQIMTRQTYSFIAGLQESDRRYC